MTTTQLLSQIPARSQAQVIRFSPHIDHNLRERLLAYGLIPGQQIQVLAQKPLTLLLIDYTELALEKELANCVEVSRLSS
jgi:Fe2+ transport system protein FeoA